MDNEKRFFSLEPNGKIFQKNITGLRTLINHFESEGFPYNEQTKYEKGLTYRNIEKVMVQNNIQVVYRVFF